MAQADHAESLSAQISGQLAAGAGSRANIQRVDISDRENTERQSSPEKVPQQGRKKGSQVHILAHLPRVGGAALELVAGALGTRAARLEAEQLARLVSK